MTRTGFFRLIIWLLVPVVLNAQTEFRAGTSQVGIEPDKSLISLHLGGYGAPRDGRFTLQWKKLEHMPDVKTFGGLQDKLIAVAKNELLYKHFSDNPSGWISAGDAGNISALTALNGKIYAVSSSGKFLVTDANKKIRWRELKIPDKHAVSLASAGSRLFALDQEGTIWQTDLSHKVPEWKLLESVDGIVSIAANSMKMFAITGDGVLYQCDPSRKEILWLKAAYRNNHTIKEDIGMITIAGNTIYGISREGVLYEGEHRSEGNLTARALAISDGGKTVVIINADICGLNDTYTGLLKETIEKRHKLPPGAVFINSSHTHFAPVSQNWLTWQEANQRPDSVYLYSTLWNGILDAVGEAVSQMTPARLSFGRGAVDIGYNRSLKDHPELYDNSVDVLKIEYPGDNSESYLFLAACHPVFSTAGTLHYTISANYPGVARKLVEERTNTQNALFLQGTAGDINPRDNGEYITGERLANEVMAVISKPMTELRGGISYFLDTINVPITPWPREEIIKYREENSTRPGDIYSEKNVKWSDLMLKYYAEGSMPNTLPVYVHTINIGNWKLVGFSRETTTSYGFGVKKLWPDKLVSVAGYTNDVSSYLPMSLHIEARNYEGLDSFFWYGMPAVFPVNVHEIIMDKIAGLKR